MRQRKRKPLRRAGFSEDAAAPYDASAKSATPKSAAPKSAAPMRQTVELGAAGRLVIPAPMRRALGVKTGDRLTVRVEGDELRIQTYESAIRRVQERIRPYLPDNAVDQFVRWKRDEAAKEDAKLERRLKDERRRP
jgi:AbrB family looped-hinge helix DNA binding protein